MRATRLFLTLCLMLSHAAVGAPAPSGDPMTATDPSAARAKAPGSEASTSPGERPGERPDERPDAAEAATKSAADAAPDAGSEGSSAQGPNLAEFKKLFRARDDAAKEKQLDAWVESSLERHPGNFEVLWRAGLVRQWQGEEQGTGERAKALGKEAWALGDEARALEPDRVEGHYVAALGLARYSQAVGIMAAIFEGLEGQYNERLEKALELDEGFDGGGPLLTQGRTYFELPWPKRDLRRSIKILRKTVAEHPGNLRAHLYLAESLEADGKKQLALESARTAASGSVSYDPPEGRKIKRLAKSLVQKLEKELK